MDQHAHSLLLSFDRDEPAFADGFELGRLWHEIRTADDLDEVTAEVHSRNAEMLIRIGEATGRHVHSEQLDDTWVTVTYGPAERLESS